MYLTDIYAVVLYITARKGPTAEQVILTPTLLMPLGWIVSTLGQHILGMIGARAVTLIIPLGSLVLNDTCVLHAKCKLYFCSFHVVKQTTDIKSWSNVNAFP